MTIAGLTLRPQTSFAQVASAVLNQPWIHSRSVSGNVDLGESWFSPAKGISASRRPESIEYRDYRSQVYYTYNPAEGVLYRGPTAERVPLGDPESMITAIKVLLQNGRTVDRPLERLGFLGSQRDEMKVIDQKVERVTEQGHGWLEYRLTVKHVASTEPLRMVFRVDLGTKLPELCRMEGQWYGKPLAMETHFAYPERGPADIYDLGVPKATKLVDRVPTGDLERILNALKVGRERMDDYRAVFVNRMEGIDYAWWTERLTVFYRKGYRFRTDFIGGPKGKPTTVQRPAEGEDLAKWWSARSKLFVFYPGYVLLESAFYSSVTKAVQDPDGSEHLDIVSVNKTNYNTKPGEMVPVDYSMRPEFACRPPMGIGREDIEPLIDMHPTEGPPGCILLRIRHTSTKDRIVEKNTGGIADETRYWLDPERDYIVMRWDMIHPDGNGKEVVIESDLTEGVARSPHGVWYATKIRRKNTVNAGTAKSSDQVYHIYVEFDAQLPDSLFEPPKIGRVH